MVKNEKNFNGYATNMESKTVVFLTSSMMKYSFSLVYND